MATLVNRAKMTTATTGTGTITLGSAVGGFRSFADAGVADGDTVRYVIEDGNDWEIGTGTYTASGTTLSRTVIESSNSDAALNLSGNAIVFVTAIAQDIVQPSDLALVATTGDYFDLVNRPSGDGINAARIGAAIAAQPLLGEASLLALYADNAYARGDRSGLTTAVDFSNLHDFARATIRAGFDVAGDLAIFAVGAPRFVYGVGGSREGLAIGPQITNVQPYASDITNAEWSKTGGAVSGTRFTEDASTGNHNVQTGARSFTAGTRYVIYADLGASRDRDVRIILPGTAFSSAGNITLAPDHSAVVAGSQAGLSGGVVALPDGTYRLWITAEANVTTSGTLFVGMVDGTTTYTGDGTSGFDLHRFQIATGVYPGDFVETAASPVTHEPDLLEVKHAAVADVLSATEGAVLWKGAVFPPSETVHLFNLAGAVGAADRLQVTCTTGGSIVCNLISGGVSVAGLALGTIVFGQEFSVAVSYSAAKLSAVLSSGAGVQTDTSVTIPSFVRATVCKNFNNLQIPPSNPRLLAIFPRALSDAELQAITT